MRGGIAITVEAEYKKSERKEEERWLNIAGFLPSPPSSLPASFCRNIIAVKLIVLGPFFLTAAHSHLPGFLHLRRYPDRGLRLRQGAAGNLDRLRVQLTGGPGHLAFHPTSPGPLLDTRGASIPAGGSRSLSGHIRIYPPAPGLLPSLPIWSASSLTPSSWPR